MTEPNDLSPELDADEQDLARRLGEQRPVPSAGFRGALGRYLIAHDPRHGPRPAQLWETVAGYVGAGGLLIAIGALQATGHL